MHYGTCRGCANRPADCSRRQEVARGIKGLGLTAIKFTCKSRQPKFGVGQRILFDTRLGGDWEGEEVRFAGTVIKERKPGRFIVRVDDGESYSDEEAIAPECFENQSGYLSLSYLNMQPLEGEPSREVCPVCDALVDYEDICWGAGLPGTERIGCLRSDDKGEG